MRGLEIVDDLAFDVLYEGADLGLMRISPALEFLFLEYAVLAGSLVENNEKLPLGSIHIVYGSILVEIEFILAVSVGAHFYHPVHYHAQEHRRHHRIAAAVGTFEV